jgi:hypothetical protein
MPTIVHSTYDHAGAGDLMSYCEHEQAAELKDHMGREMTGRQKQRIIDKSEQVGMERHVMISPENSENLTREQIERVTRDTVHEIADEQDRETLQYAYTVHEEGGDRSHSHVVMVGSKTDLYMNESDLNKMRGIAHEKAQKQEREIVPEIKSELSQEKSRGVTR